MEEIGGGGEKKRVVVIGGGIAGSLLAKTLQHHADVVLIDAKEYLEIPWANLRSMVEPAVSKRSVINHVEYLPSARVITLSATDIADNKVSTAEGRLIAYDYLVIATGHTDTGALTKVEKLSRYEAGGPTGVELAGEIAVDFPDKKVKLVHRGSRLLEFLGARAGRKTLDWLTSRNVDVILGQSVDLSSCSDGVYQTSGGETVSADCHFVCTGKPIGSSWLKETALKNSLDIYGRLMVDGNLRVKGFDNIFAIGDITDISEIKQGYLAQRHALVAARNLKLLMGGGKESRMVVYKPSSPLAIVSLGRRDAVAQIYCVTIIGWIPGLIKSRDLFVGKTRKQLGLKSNIV